jgi:hypothetical protein
MTLTLFSLFALFGGFFSLIRVLSNYFLKDFQGFAIKNSMIKKLYTEEPPPEGWTDSDDDDQPKRVKKMTQEEMDAENAFLARQDAGPESKLEEAVSSRDTFSYKFRSYWWFNCKKEYSCSSCCCKKPKPTRQHRLYQDGLKKINHEFDVLRLINLMRVQEFMGRSYLKAHQLMLVKFFQSYTLQDPKCPKKGPNEMN